MWPAAFYLVALLLIALGLLSALKSISLLIKLDANRYFGIGKDFDVYYLPLLLINTFGAIYVFFLTGVKMMLGVEEAEQVCSNSVVLFVHFLGGTCFLQIALNWMEVAGSYKFHYCKYRSTRMLSV